MTQFPDALDEAVLLVDGSRSRARVRATSSCAERRRARRGARPGGRRAPRRRAGWRSDGPRRRKVSDRCATREKLVRSVDQGDFFRVPVDARDLNFSAYYDEGDLKKSHTDDCRSRRRTARRTSRRPPGGPSRTSQTLRASGERSASPDARWSWSTSTSSRTPRRTRTCLARSQHSRRGRPRRHGPQPASRRTTGRWCAPRRRASASTAPRWCARRARRPALSACSRWSTSSWFCLRILGARRQFRGADVVLAATSTGPGRARVQLGGPAARRRVRLPQPDVYQESSGGRPASLGDCWAGCSARIDSGTDRRAARVVVSARDIADTSIGRGSRPQRTIAS